MSFISVVLDTITYWIIRIIGTKLPSGIVPFISGLYTTTLMLIYCTIFNPFDFDQLARMMGLSAQTTAQQAADTTYLHANLFGLVAGFFGWIAIECMTIGVRISKSARAQYAQ